MEGKLFFKGRYVKEFHDSAVGGHSRDLKTYLRAADLYWHGMRKDMASYVFECGIHQQHKSSNLSPAGLLQALPLPSLVWDEISMDSIEGLPQYQRA